MTKQVIRAILVAGIMLLTSILNVNVDILDEYNDSSFGSHSVTFEEVKLSIDDGEGNECIANSQCEVRVVGNSNISSGTQLRLLAHYHTITEMDGDGIYFDDESVISTWNSDGSSLDAEEWTFQLPSDARCRMLEVRIQALVEGTYSTFGVENARIQGACLDMRVVVGRVTDLTGSPIGNEEVTMLAMGTPHSTQTNSFGLFRFDLSSVSTGMIQDISINIQVGDTLQDYVLDSPLELVEISIDNPTTVNPPLDAEIVIPFSGTKDTIQPVLVRACTNGSPIGMWNLWLSDGVNSIELNLENNLRIDGYGCYVGVTTWFFDSAITVLTFSMQFDSINLTDNEIVTAVHTRGHVSAAAIGGSTSYNVATNSGNGLLASSLASGSYLILNQIATSVNQQGDISTFIPGFDSLKDDFSISEGQSADMTSVNGTLIGELLNWVYGNISNQIPNWDWTVRAQGMTNANWGCVLHELSEDGPTFAVYTSFNGYGDRRVTLDKSTLRFIDIVNNEDSIEENHRITLGITDGFESMYGGQDHGCFGEFNSGTPCFGLFLENEIGDDYPVTVDSSIRYYLAHVELLSSISDDDNVELTFDMTIASSWSSACAEVDDGLLAPISELPDIDDGDSCIEIVPKLNVILKVLVTNEGQDISTVLTVEHRDKGSRIHFNVEGEQREIEDEDWPILELKSIATLFTFDPGMMSSGNDPDQSDRSDSCCGDEEESNRQRQHQDDGFIFWMDDDEIENYVCPNGVSQPPVIGENGVSSSNTDCNDTDQTNYVQWTIGRMVPTTTEYLTRKTIIFYDHDNKLKGHNPYETDNFPLITHNSIANEDNADVLQFAFIYDEPPESADDIHYHFIITVDSTINYNEACKNVNDCVLVDRSEEEVQWWSSDELHSTPANGPGLEQRRKSSSHDGSNLLLVSYPITDDLSSGFSHYGNSIFFEWNFNLIEDKHNVANEEIPTRWELGEVDEDDPSKYISNE